MCARGREREIRAKCSSHLAILARRARLFGLIFESDWHRRLGAQIARRASQSRSRAKQFKMNSGRRFFCILSQLPSLAGCAHNPQLDEASRKRPRDLSRRRLISPITFAQKGTPFSPQRPNSRTPQKHALSMHRCPVCTAIKRATDLPVFVLNVTPSATTSFSVTRTYTIS